MDRVSGLDTGVALIDNFDRQFKHFIFGNIHTRQTCVVLTRTSNNRDYVRWSKIQARSHFYRNRI